MPEATLYAFEEKNKKAFQANEAAFTEEHKKRSEEIKRRWKYYDGDHDLPLKRQQDGYNDSVIVNHVEALTDRLTAFLIGDGISFDASAGSEGQTADDRNIEALLTANRGDLLIDTLASAGAIEGHNTVRIQRTEAGEPRLTRIKQQHFSAFWDPFDMTRVLWYRLQHIAGAAGKRIDYVRGSVDESFEVDHTADGWTEVVYSMPKENRWKVEKVEAWPFPWPPLVDWQNLPNPGGYYGKNDVAGAIRLNDALNFILSNTQRIVKHYGAPRTIGIGFDAGDVIPTEVGGLFTINKPRSEAEVFNLELQSDGALIQWLAGMIQAGLWESGGMVDPSNVKDSIGQLTNFGLRILFTNAIKRTGKKRTLYAEAFEQIVQRALEVGAQPVPASVATIWPDVLPEDEATINTLLEEWRGGIISKQTYRKLRGYDHEQEEKRLTVEMIPAMVTTGAASTQPDANAPENLESTKGLNGAQLAAVMDVLARMQEGALPAPAAIELLVTAGIDRVAAEKIVTLAQKAEVTISTPAGNRPPTTPTAAVNSREER
jgi:hypothetical protein